MRFSPHAISRNLTQDSISYRPNASVHSKEVSSSSGRSTRLVRTIDLFLRTNIHPFLRRRPTAIETLRYKKLRQSRGIALTLADIPTRIRSNSICQSGSRLSRRKWKTTNFAAATAHRPNQPRCRATRRKLVTGSISEKRKRRKRKYARLRERVGH